MSMENSFVEKRAPNKRKPKEIVRLRAQRFIERYFRKAEDSLSLQAHLHLSDPELYKKVTENAEYRNEFFILVVKNCFGPWDFLIDENREIFHDLSDVAAQQLLLQLLNDPSPEEYLPLFKDLSWKTTVAYFAAETPLVRTRSRALRVGAFPSKDPEVLHSYGLNPDQIHFETPFEDRNDETRSDDPIPGIINVDVLAKITDHPQIFSEEAKEGLTKILLHSDQLFSYPRHYDIMRFFASIHAPSNQAIERFLAEGGHINENEIERVLESSLMQETGLYTQTVELAIALSPDCTDRLRQRAVTSFQRFNTLGQSIICEELLATWERIGRPLPVAKEDRERIRTRANKETSRRADRDAHKTEQQPLYNKINVVSSAGSFYLGNLIEHEASMLWKKISAQLEDARARTREQSVPKRTFHPTEYGTFWRVHMQLEKHLRQTTERVNTWIKQYLVIAVCSELRHAKGLDSSQVGSVYTRLIYSDYIGKWAIIDRVRKELRTLTDEEVILFLDEAERAFQGGYGACWDERYGGNPWVEIARTAKKLWLAYDMPNIPLLDHVFDLEHHSGKVFDKDSEHIPKMDGSLKRLLNDKRYVKQAEELFYTTRQARIDSVKQLPFIHISLKSSAINEGVARDAQDDVYAMGLLDKLRQLADKLEDIGPYTVPEGD